MARMYAAQPSEMSKLFAFGMPKAMPHMAAWAGSSMPLVSSPTRFRTLLRDSEHIHIGSNLCKPVLPKVKLPSVWGPESLLEATYCPNVCHHDCKTGQSLRATCCCRAPQRRAGRTFRSRRR